MMSVARKLNHKVYRENAVKRCTSVSFPRSGHHLLVNCLTKYYSRNLHFENFSGNNNLHEILEAGPLRYCEYYKHCRHNPCTDPNANFQKVHDFHLFKSHHQKSLNLNQDEIRIDNRRKYIIQFRENAVASIVSEYKRSLNSGQFFKKGIEDSESFFTAFNADYFEFWKRFMDKWVLNLPKNAIAISYESFLANPESALVDVLKFLGEPDPDIIFLREVIEKMNISPKNDYREFKYYESYLDEMNQNAKTDLQKQLKSLNHTIRNKISTLPPHTKKNMNKPELNRPVNEKLKASYEKSLIYEKALQSIEDSLNSKIEIIKLKNERIDQLEDALAVLKSDIEALRNKSINDSVKDSDFKKLESQLKEQIETSSEQNAALVKKLQEENTINQALSKKLQKTKNKRNLLKAKLKQFNEQSEQLIQLKESQNNLVGDLKQAHEANAKLENQLKESQNKLVEDLKQAHEANAELETQLKRLNKKHKNKFRLKTEKLEKNKKRVKILQAKIIDTENKTQALEKLNSDLYTQLKTSKEQYTSKISALEIKEIENEKTIDLAGKQIQTLEGYLQSKIDEFDELRIDNEANLEKIKELETLNSEQLNQTYKLNEELNLLYNIQDKQELQLKVLIEANRNFTDQLNKEQSQNQALEKHAASGLEELRQLRKAYTVLRTELDSSNKTNNGLRESNEIQKNLIAEQQTEYNELHESMVADKTALHTQLSGLSKQNNTLKQQISKLENLIESRDLELHLRANYLLSKTKELTERQNDLDNLQISNIRSQSEIAKIKASYSWKIGWKITRLIEKTLGWLPFVKNRT